MHPLQIEDLIAAARRGDFSLLHACIRAGMPLDGPDEIGLTPLHHASSEGHAAVVQLLLEHGVAPDSPSARENMTALHCAAYRGHQAICQILLDSGATVDAVDTSGTTPLYSAVAEGHTEVAAFLLRQGAHPNVRVGFQERTLLHTSASLGMIDLIPQLLAAGADAHAVDWQGATPLHAACFAGHAAVAAVLLAHEASMYARSNDGELPFHTAVRWGHEDVAELLYTRMGAAASGEFGSPLHAAAALHNLAGLHDMIARGMNIQPRDRQGKTPLHWVANGRQQLLARIILTDWARTVGFALPESAAETPPAPLGQVIAALLAYGHPIDPPDSEDSTPLLEALKWSQIEAAELLIALGADINQQDSHEWTPLLLAAGSGRTALVALLIRRGARLDAVFGGSNALHRASRSGHVQTVEYLLEAGFDPNPDSDQLTPLHQAASMGHAAVVACLLRYGADPNIRNADGKTPADVVTERLQELASYGNADQRERRQQLTEILQLLPQPASQTSGGVAARRRARRRPTGDTQGANSRSLASDRPPDIPDDRPTGTAPPLDPATLQAAETLLATLPLDMLPPVAPLPSGSFMPFSPPVRFVGRTSELRHLARALKEHEIAVIRPVVGAGSRAGTGKTSLALEFAHRYGSFFAGGVFWLGCADPLMVPAVIAACGRELGLYRDAHGLRLSDQVALVQQAWQSPLPRLLIFDNCEDEALLHEWLPLVGGCRVLVTTRRAAWDATLGIALPLDVLSRPDSIALLRQFRSDLPANDPQMAALAQELGDLPLALTMAGCVLQKNPAGSPGAYLAAVHSMAVQDQVALHGTGPAEALSADAWYAGRAFDISVRHMRSGDPVDDLARALLARAACLAPGQPIPRYLLLATVGIPDDAAYQQASQALQRLIDLGMLEAYGDEALRLHGLLAPFVQARLDDPAAQEAAERALAERAQIELNSMRRAGAQPWLLTHLQYATRVAERRTDARAGTLCYCLGSCLSHLTYGNQVFRNSLPNIPYDRVARAYYERALAIWEQVYGSVHQNVALCLSSLGMLLKKQGNLAEARAYYERELAICEQLYGPAHQDLAMSLTMLSMVLQEQGDLAGAQAYRERAMAINEQDSEARWGRPNPNMPGDLLTQGWLLRQQGDRAGERAAYERALAIVEQELQPNDSTLSHIQIALGGLLEDQGDQAGARAVHERVLVTAEEMFGPTDLQVGICLSHFGELLQRQGDLAGARAALERMLAIYEQQYGPVSLTAASGLESLGVLLQAQGDLAGARAYYERALAIWEREQEPMWSGLAGCLAHFGGLLKQQGDLAGARAYYERALAIVEQAQGPMDSYTAEYVLHLGKLLKEQGDLAGARAYYERALAIWEQEQGPQNPNIAECLTSLGKLLEAQGDLAGAQAYYERALAGAG